MTLRPTGIPPRLILASRSPRRAALLRDAGYVFTQADPPFVDPPQPDATFDPGRLALNLALAKARSAAGDPKANRSDPSVVLGADTIVIASDGTLLGQPADRTDAQRMLALLIAQVHRVVTAVALIGFTPGLPTSRPEGEVPSPLRTVVDTARVHLGAVAARTLNDYLDGGLWRGKAGAYNLSELQNHWPFKVTGDPDTVVGLPMVKLRTILGELGITPSRVSQ